MFSYTVAKENLHYKEVEACEPHKELFYFDRTQEVKIIKIEPTIIEHETIMN